MIITQFIEDYIKAQHQLEWSEFSGGASFEVILTALLAVVTGGVGAVASLGAQARKISQLKKLGELLSELAELLKQLPKPKKMTLRQLKEVEDKKGRKTPKPVSKQGNIVGSVGADDGRMQGESVVPDNTRGILGPNSGSNLAAKVTPGGNGQAITGHGFFRFGDGSAVVPEGTTLVLPRDGIKIKDTSGRVLETIDVERLANSGPVAQKRLIRQQLDDLGVTHKPTRRQVLSDLSDLQVVRSGNDLPNFTVAPPNFQNKPLNIFENSTSVETPTFIDQLLKPDAGFCSLATCTEFITR